MHRRREEQVDAALVVVGVGALVRLREADHRAGGAELRARARSRRSSARVPSSWSNGKSSSGACHQRGHRRRGEDRAQRGGVVGVHRAQPQPRRDEHRGSGQGGKRGVHALHRAPPGGRLPTVIVGIGIDVVNVPRFSASLKRTPGPARPAVHRRPSAPATTATRAPRPRSPRASRRRRPSPRRSALRRVWRGTTARWSATATGGRGSAARARSRRGPRARRRALAPLAHARRRRRRRLRHRGGDVSAAHRRPATPRSPSTSVRRARGRRRWRSCPRARSCSAPRPRSRSRPARCCATSWAA